MTRTISILATPPSTVTHRSRLTMAIFSDTTIHDVGFIKARTTGTSGAPLIIEAWTADRDLDRGRAEITLFTDDQTLTDRLIAAINETVAARQAELKTEAVEAA